MIKSGRIIRQITAGELRASQMKTYGVIMADDEGCINELLSLLSAHHVLSLTEEKHTLETLLYCPLSVRQIFRAKVMASFLLSMLVSLISFAVMLLVTELEAYFLLGTLLVPGVNWLVILILVSPAISLIAVTLIVRGSAKARTVEESQQSAVFLILPIILLVVGQTTGLMLVNGWILLGLGVICALIAALMLKMCMGRFTYEMLLK